MPYCVLFEKRETHWWDEDGLGKCAFGAANDGQAWVIAIMLATRMNRQYDRLGESRYVFIARLVHVDEAALERIVLPTVIEPFRDRTAMCRILKWFYPLRDGRRGSQMRLFNSWKEKVSPKPKFFHAA